MGRGDETRLMENHTTEMLLSAIGALAGVVAYLYRNTMAHFAEVERKLNDCESDRLKLWEALSVRPAANHENED